MGNMSVHATLPHGGARLKKLTLDKETNSKLE